MCVRRVSSFRRENAQGAHSTKHARACTYSQYLPKKTVRGRRPAQPSFFVTLMTWTASLLPTNQQKKVASEEGEPRRSERYERGTVLILHGEDTSYSVVLAADASIGSLQSVLDPATAVPTVHRSCCSRLHWRGQGARRVRAAGGGRAVAAGVLFSRRSLSRGATSRSASCCCSNSRSSELRQHTSRRGPRAWRRCRRWRALLDYGGICSTTARHVIDTGAQRLRVSHACVDELPAGRGRARGGGQLARLAQRLSHKYGSSSKERDRRELARTFETDLAAPAASPSTSRPSARGWAPRRLDSCKRAVAVAARRQLYSSPDVEAAQFALAWATSRRPSRRRRTPTPSARRPSSRRASARRPSGRRGGRDRGGARLGQGRGGARALARADDADGATDGAADAEGSASVGGGQRPSLSAARGSARRSRGCGAGGEERAHVDEALPELLTIDGELRAVQEAASLAKHGASVALYRRLRSVSAIQSQIAELRNKLHLYTSLLNRVDMYCAQLRLMRRLPETYHACIDEVVRRQRAAEETRRHIAGAAEAAAAMREVEASGATRSCATTARLPRGLPALSRLLQGRRSWR